MPTEGGTEAGALPGAGTRSAPWVSFLYLCQLDVIYDNTVSGWWGGRRKSVAGPIQGTGLHPLLSLATQNSSSARALTLLTFEPNEEGPSFSLSNALPNQILPGQVLSDSVKLVLSSFMEVLCGSHDESLSNLVRILQPRGGLAY